MGLVKTFRKNPAFILVVLVVVWFLWNSPINNSYSMMPLTDPTDIYSNPEKYDGKLVRTSGPVGGNVCGDGSPCISGSDPRFSVCITKESLEPFVGGGGYVSSGKLEVVGHVKGRNIEAVWATNLSILKYEGFTVTCGTGPGKTIRIENVGETTVRIRNTGPYVIELPDEISVYVEDELMDCSWGIERLDFQETATCTLSSCPSGKIVKVEGPNNNDAILCP